jgi:hypothetical protein
MIELVVDTNVFLNLYSCHDVIGQLAEPLSDVSSEKLAFRRGRMREAALFAFYLDAVGAQTHSLQTEALEMLERKASRDAVGGQDFHADFTRTMIWFVIPSACGAWTGNFRKPTSRADWHTRLADQGRLSPDLVASLRSLPDLKEGEEPAFEEGKSHVMRPLGNDADLWHIATAKELGLRLVSNEGLKESGVHQPGKIGKRAEAEGVQKVLPRDVYRGTDEDFCAHQMVNRLRSAAPGYLRERFEKNGPDKSADYLYGYFLPFYKELLLG